MDKTPIYVSVYLLYIYAVLNYAISPSVKCVQSTHCTALYCIVLHCTALYCIVLHCTELYCIVLYLVGEKSILTSKGEGLNYSPGKVLESFCCKPSMQGLIATIQLD